jgi:hypothetical protein
MPSDSGVRLSNAQKRDLLGMSAAAMITTALIAAPMLLPHDSLPAFVDPAIITAGAIPTPSLIQSLSAPAPQYRVVRASAAAVPQRRRERAPLPASPVQLASTPVAVSAPVLVAMETSSTRPPKPLGKRIAGLFTGDGTYTVRPFPTISTERQ